MSRSHQHIISDGFYGSVTHARRTAHALKIKKWKVRRCMLNFCQDLGEASELAMIAQRVASALRV